MVLFNSLHTCDSCYTRILRLSIVFSSRSKVFCHQDELNLFFLAKKVTNVLGLYIMWFPISNSPRNIGKHHRKEYYWPPYGVLPISTFFHGFGVVTYFMSAFDFFECLIYDQVLVNQMSNKTFFLVRHLVILKFRCWCEFPTLDSNYKANPASLIGYFDFGSQNTDFKLRA